MKLLIYQNKHSLPSTPTAQVTQVLSLKKQTVASRQQCGGDTTCIPLVIHLQFDFKPQTGKQYYFQPPCFSVFLHHFYLVFVKADFQCSCHRAPTVLYCSALLIKHILITLFQSNHFLEQLPWPVSQSHSADR